VSDHLERASCPRLVMDVDDRISRFIENLPILTINDLPEEQDCCPICFLEFSECCTEDETGFSKGVALLACGHAFCVNECVFFVYCGAETNGSKAL